MGSWTIILVCTLFFLGIFFWWLRAQKLITEEGTPKEQLDENHLEISEPVISFVEFVKEYPRNIKVDYSFDITDSNWTHNNRKVVIIKEVFLIEDVTNFKKFTAEIEVLDVYDTPFTSLEVKQDSGEGLDWLTIDEKIYLYKELIIPYKEFLQNKKELLRKRDKLRKLRKERKGREQLTNIYKKGK